MEVLTTDGERAAHRGVYEITLETDTPIEDPYVGSNITATFERPDGTTVPVDAFYDGDGQFRARAYCDTIGTWRWESEADNPGLVDSGSFEVTPSGLPGKLRQHSEDSRRLAYDDGEWFLHIGDTGYRYPVDAEAQWQEYVDGTVRAGTTKIRTWFARSRHGVEAVFTDDRLESGELDLEYWKEMDRRYRYALEEYPHLQIQIIPYGEDGELLRAYEDEPIARAVGRYAQARFSAFPTVYWCLANDVAVTEEEPDPAPEDRQTKTLDGISKSTIDAIGQDFDEREPWGTLITSHQQRTTGYDFVDAEWSDLVTIHDLDQGAGERVREYRELAADPVIFDEDRYEYYREPDVPHYFFRRLLWVNLISGGHPTYGGYRTYEPYDGDEQGLRAYQDTDLVGMDEFNWIHHFFEVTGVSLVSMNPDQGIVRDDPGRAVCCHDARVYLAYFANPDGDDPETAGVSEEPQSTTLELPPGIFDVRWFDPRNAEWTGGETVKGDRCRFTTPGGRDWVLLLERASADR